MNGDKMHKINDCLEAYFLYSAAKGDTKDLQNNPEMFKLLQDKGFIYANYEVSEEGVAALLAHSKEPFNI